MKPARGMHCPAFDIFGTYFPSWMVCTLVGIAVTIVAFRVLSLLHASHSIRAPLLFYPCLALSATSLAWLGWFGH